MAPHTITHCINDDASFLYCTQVGSPASRVTRVILNIEY